jgi:hypothetical protein
MAELQMHSPSSGHFSSKNHATFPVQEPGYFYEKQEYVCEQDLPRNRKQPSSISTNLTA